MLGDILGAQINERETFQQDASIGTFDVNIHDLENFEFGGLSLKELADQDVPNEETSEPDTPQSVTERRQILRSYFICLQHHRDR